METASTLMDLFNSIFRPQSTQSVPIDFIVYLSCFALGLIYTLISATIGHFFGGDLDHGHDAVGGDVHAGDVPGLSFFSPTVMASFLTAFGGFGMIFYQIPATRPIYISAPLAIVTGLIIAALVFWMFESLFSKTQSSSESRVGTLVGHIATVITPIPEQGVGEISYVQNGTRYTAPAREETGIAVRNGDNVKITRVVSTQFFVTKI